MSTLRDSGSYVCNVNGLESEDVRLDVVEPPSMLPKRGLESTAITVESAFIVNLTLSMAWFLYAM